MRGNSRLVAEQKRQLFEFSSFGSYIKFPVGSRRWSEEIDMSTLFVVFIAVFNCTLVYQTMEKGLSLSNVGLEFVVLSDIVFGAAGRSSLSLYGSDVVVLVHPC